MSFLGLREYARSSPWPEENTINIQLKQGLAVALDIPDFAVAPISENTGSLYRVALSHAAFKAVLHPDQNPDSAFFKRCVAEVNAVNLFFPDIKNNDLKVVFTAWLGFACVMDDFLDILHIDNREAALRKAIKFIESNGSSPAAYQTSSVNDNRICGLTRELYEHTTRYLSHKSASAFFKGVSEVLNAHFDEVRFLQSSERDSLPAYTYIRRRTISLSPFFEVIKSEYLPKMDGNLNNAFLHLQEEVSYVTGLQNDMVGLIRDLQDGEELNAVVVLLRGFNITDMFQPNPKILARCVAMVNAEHNRGVARCLDAATQVHRVAEGSASPIAEVEKVARHMLMMCETHLKWAAAAKRYRLETNISERTSLPTPPSTRPSTASSGGGVTTPASEAEPEAANTGPSSLRV
ncbi:hypothetical protein N0V88_007270 [Collariella sp. IMI 366227]|nr:hypothetical protein N0V88_007270 [Collariella sp. IMI 366227]